MALSTSGRVVALFVSPRRTFPLQACTQVEAVPDRGFEGDAHARPGGSRQVLLLDLETLTELEVEPGALKENITTAGLNLSALTLGTQLRVGEALLQITKECEPCDNVDKLRPGLQESIRGRRGLLARVVEGGAIRVGDPIETIAG